MLCLIITFDIVGFLLLHMRSFKMKIIINQLEIDDKWWWYMNFQEKQKLDKEKGVFDDFQA